MSRSVAGLALLLLAACTPPAPPPGDPVARHYADREAIEAVLYNANLGFELGEPDRFASAFAPDAVFELNGEGPVHGYQKMRYEDDLEKRDGAWLITRRQRIE